MFGLAEGQPAGRRLDNQGWVAGWLCSEIDLSHLIIQYCITDETAGYGTNYMS